MSQPLVLRFDVEDNGSVKMERINSNLDTLGKKLGQTAEKSSYFDRVFARVSKAFSAVQSAIFSLQGAFVALGISMTAAGFIKTAAAMETMQTKMIQMTGSVEAGNQMFRLATKYGAETTYSVMESMSSLVALKSAVSSLDIGMLEKLVKVAGDLAARSPVKMSLEESMGQVIRMWSAGASAADMFREKGILAMLGFKTKVEYTVEETRKKLMEAWEDPEKRIKGGGPIPGRHLGRHCFDDWRQVGRPGPDHHAGRDL
jgi:hypothetical protein